MITVKVYMLVFAAILKTGGVPATVSHPYFSPEACIEAAAQGLQNFAKDERVLTAGAYGCETPLEFQIDESKLEKPKADPVPGAPKYKA